MENNELKQNLSRGETWVRGLFMLLFAFAYSVAEVVLVALALFQFFAQLFTGKVNERLLAFGQQLSTYLYQLLLFFTFNSEQRPYPFSGWPRGAPAQPRPPAAGTSAPRKKAASKKKASAAKAPPPGDATSGDTPETPE